MLSPFACRSPATNARNGLRGCRTAQTSPREVRDSARDPVQAIEENLNSASEKLTPQAIGNNILNYLSGSMVPLIPVLMCAGLFKTVGVILGPTMAGVISETSDIYILMNILYDAAFYFLPIYLGYNAAKNIGVTPVLGAFMGGILIDPAMIQMAQDGAAFSVYGIPCIPGNYTQSVIPILLSVWAMR